MADKLKYACGECGVEGTRLYRRYQTFLEHQRLYCTKCAIKDQKQVPDPQYRHCLGNLVAAVPTPDGESFWGYTSVPPEGVAWWDALPELAPGQGWWDVPRREKA